MKVSSYLHHKNIIYMHDLYIYDYVNTCRSSHQKSSIKKCVFRNFAKFTGKRLCQNLFFDKVAGLRPATLLKKRPWHRCFPVIFVKFLRTTFYRTPPDDCFYTCNGEINTFSKQNLIWQGCVLTFWKNNLASFKIVSVYVLT